MKITFRDGLFLGLGGPDDRGVLKTAGFFLHPGRKECQRTITCPACKAGLERVWFTRRPESAVRLLAHADDLARAALSRHVSSVAGSRAVDADVEIPSPPGLNFYGYQLAGVKYMMERPATLLSDEMGCIDGDAVIRINRGGGSKKKPLKVIWKRFNGLETNRRHSWDKNIPTMVTSLCDGVLRLNRVVKVLDKGIRQVVLLTLKSGKIIRLTPDHEVACPGEEWRPASDLKPGDKVLTNGTAACRECGSIGPGEHIHHKNKDKADNRPENLEIMSASDHAQEHVDFRRLDGGSTINGGIVTFIPKVDEVVSVTPAGASHVYDIVMADPYRNFVANGIIVHNCGKSIQAIGLISADTEIKSALILCPASLTRNWLREVQRWLVPGDRKFYFHIQETDEDIPRGANFVIASYNRVTILFTKCGACEGQKMVPCAECEGAGTDRKDARDFCQKCSGKKGTQCPECAGVGRVVRGGQKVWKSLMSRSWDLIACDEAHLLKNQDSARTKCILGNWKKDKPGLISKATKKKIMITGTPLPNRPIEIWTLAATCAPETFGDFTQFARRYCDMHVEFLGKKKLTKVTGSSNLEELQEKLRAACMIRRLKSEVLSDLPPKTRQIISLTVPPEAARLVDEELATWRAKFETELAVVREEFAMAEETKDQGAWKEAVGKLEYIQKIAFIEMAKVRHLVAVAKLPMVLEHLDECLEGGRKVTVFAHHKDIIAAIAERYGDRAVSLVGDTSPDDRQLAVDRFQTEPGVQLFIGSILAASMGITLTASSHVVFAELSWVPWHLTQAEDRQHRIGQKNNVLVQHLVWDGSLDARMAHMLVDKQEIAERALDRPTAVERSLFGMEDVVEAVPPWEKALLREAILHVAQKEAGQGGFSSFDRTIGQKLATWTGAWSDRQAHLGRKLVQRYRGQVPAAILTELGLGTPVKTGRAGAAVGGVSAMDFVKGTS